MMIPRAFMGHALVFLVSLTVAVPSHAAARATPSARNTAVNPRRALLPRYEPQGLRINYSIELPAAAARALKAYDPRFSQWLQSDYEAGRVQIYPFTLQSTPSAVIGDFDADGSLDAVLAGHDERGSEILALISSGAAGYRIIQVEKQYDSRPPSTGVKSTQKAAPEILFFEPKGKRFDLGGDTTSVPFTLPSDGFIDARGPSLFWWDASKGAFKKQDLFPAEPGDPSASVEGYAR